jgi:hypothetical protein
VVEAQFSWIHDAAVTPKDQGEEKLKQRKRKKRKKLKLY